MIKSNTESQKIPSTILDKTGMPAGFKQRILGVTFFTNRIGVIVNEAVEGGLMVVPAAPALARDFMQSPEYREALLEADMVIADSGFMVILWWIRTGIKLPKNSGLAFLREFIKHDDFKRKKRIFWVMPSLEEELRTKQWLKGQNISIDIKNFYIAPFYGKEGSVEDDVLISQIEVQRPDIVMIGLGGGVQERLGLALRRKLSFRPGIFCIGAAIAFLTGGQARIPVWADKLYLGWLFRIIHSPKTYWKRYWEALRLAPILFRYKGELPPLRTSLPPTGHPYNSKYIGKRLFDVVFSALMLLFVFSWLSLIVGIGIKMGSPGQVFFRQKRTGLQGREFWCMKFRSMQVNGAADTEQASQNDPRITRFGRFLRRTHLDELPQFINVFRGEMSVVGPRPHMLKHTEYYAGRIEGYMLRHEVRPGVTGWAQVTGFSGEIRNMQDMEGRVARDIWYIRHQSLLLDIRIIARTVGMMFRKDKWA
jgi:exopolysaccharide biosynthesis WecB/TagA/CpsF family protein